MEPETLVLVHPLALPSPMANGVQTLATAAALARRGRRVLLFVRAPAGMDLAEHVVEAYGIDVPAGLELEGIGASKRSAGIFFRKRLAGLVAAREPILFLSRSLRHALFLLRARRFLSPIAGSRNPKTLVQEFHNLEHRVARESGATRRAAILEGREARVCLGADGLLSISEPLAADLCSTFSPRVPLAVIEDGVDVARFRAVARAKPSGVRTRIVYAGSFFPHKGVDSLVDAVGLSPEGVTLELVGGHPADAFERLRARVASTPELAARVRLLGPVASRDVPAALSRADLIVLPAGPESAAQRYTSPLKLFEAMATGAPIVAAPSAAHASVLRDGETAFLAPDCDAAGLAAGIRTALADPDRARAVGRAAMEEAERFDWDQRAERILSFARTLARS